jgi:hypothetical protein
MRFAVPATALPSRTSVLIAISYPSALLLALVAFPSSAISNSPEETEVHEPVPPVVEPQYSSNPPPADAIVLFDGSDLEEWVDTDGAATQWSIENGDILLQRGDKDIVTQRKFEDVHLYLEWQVPENVRGAGQGRGNSGVFLQNRYEVQILDNWDNETYVNGMAGSVYKQHIPLVNPARRPGEWQSFEIFFKAPVFGDEGQLLRSGRVTVLLNGILVLNNVEILGTTTWVGLPSYQAHQADVIRLQKHGSTSGMRFRNIWVRELDRGIRMTDGVKGGKRTLQ